jgi:hypothetical protein
LSFQWTIHCYLCFKLNEIYVCSLQRTIATSWLLSVNKFYLLINFVSFIFFSFFLREMILCQNKNTPTSVSRARFPEWFGCKLIMYSLFKFQTREEKKEEGSPSHTSSWVTNVDDSLSVLNNHYEDNIDDDEYNLCCILSLLSSYADGIFYYSVMLYYL